MNKKYSLKKSNDIEQLIKKHQSVGNKYYAIYYDINGNTQIAVSASRKFGKAHDRNYHKRVTREILRQNLEILEGLTCLVVVKEKSIELNYTEKCNEIVKLINKIREEK